MACKWGYCRLILLVDGNEDLAKDQLGTALRKTLDMIDLVKECTDMPGPATHKEGLTKLMGHSQLAI